MTSALRGEGVLSKADIVSNLSKGGCMNLQTRGEGQKIRNVCGRPKWKPPMDSYSLCLPDTARICIWLQFDAMKMEM